MATSEHSVEAEIAAHSPGQPSLEPPIQDTRLQASLSKVLNTSGDEITHKRETLSTNQISGAFFHYYASIGTRCYSQ